MKKLAIITTHPIQYNAPFFKLLTERGNVRPRVFYTWPQAIDGFDDPDFGKRVQWDIPLLEGYDWEAVENVAKNPSSKSWSGIDCPSLIQRINAFTPDAVMVYGWNLKSHFKVMRHFKGKVPVWFRGDSHLLDERPGIKTILRRIVLQCVYRYVDKAFYVGTNNKAYYLAHGLMEKQLVYAPHAIDNERFRDTPEKAYENKARQWRMELGYSDEDIVVLFAGKLETKKNPFLLVDAFNVLRCDEKWLKLLFVGNGGLEEVTKSKANKNPKIQFISFLNQSQMPKLYRLGDVFCLPSQGPGETWGLAINEAMACGRPVIVSDKVGCGADLIKEGYNGFIFKSNDKDSLVSILERIEAVDLKQMGRNAMTFIEGWNFSAKCKAIETAFKTKDE